MDLLGQFKKVLKEKLTEINNTEDTFKICTVIDLDIFRFV